MDKRITALTAIFLALLLTSCSSLPAWLGSEEEDIDTSGKRIAVLGVGTTIEPDSGMTDVKIVIPEAKPNDQWVKSSGDRPFVPENIAAPQDIKLIDTVSVGNGAESDHHLSAGPVVVNGKIYTIDARGRVSAFDEQKMKRLWEYKIELPKKKGDSSSAGILYHMGKIYVSTGSNMVVAIDAETGSLVWSRKINSIARSAPAAEKNAVVVNTVDNKIYVLDADDGEILWVHSGTIEEMSVVGSAAPVVSNGVVFAPYSSGELYALKISDCAEIWSDALTAENSGAGASYLFADIDASPLVAGSSVYTISDDGVLIASDVASGKRLWEHSVSGNKTPWYAAGFLYILNDKSEIICLQASSGGIKWVKKLQFYRNEEKKADPIEWSGPVMAGDMLLVAGSEGELLSISPETGDVVSKIKLPKGVHASPVVVNENVYLVSDDAKLIKLGGS